MIGRGTPSNHSRIPRPIICIPLYCFGKTFAFYESQPLYSRGGTLLEFAIFIHSCLDSVDVRRFLRCPRRGLRIELAMVAMTAVVTSCASGPPSSEPPATSPVQVRGMIEKSLPRNASDRAGWAADMYAVFTALEIEPTHENVCAVVAVIEQESGFHVDPVIPRLPAIAWREIDGRAEHAGVPRLIVHTALQLKSRTGRSYTERIDSARTEKDLSDIYEDFIGAVPLGPTLFAERNPIRTRGPMQVNIAFVEQFAAARSYPYPVKSSIADEAFLRRGSLYFGTAHLLAYPASYDAYLYRFADYNAGQYASRNAAFQRALNSASGIPVVPDGALLPHGGDVKAPGGTELAVRALGKRLNMGDSAIHNALEQGKTAEFERTQLYRGIFTLADRAQGQPLPRAAIPRIQLHGPKIARSLTTEWYAHRVDQRFKRCVEQ
jgi:hypothetical protein